MFCKNCGAEINDDARFCPKCGSDKQGETQAAKKKIVEDNQIKKQIKLEFNWPYKIITTVGTALVYLFIVFCYVLADVPELLLVSPMISLIIIVVAVLYIVIKLVLGKMQYNDLEYNFYTTKVEYKDGFLNKEEKELKYKYIREVTMSQNIFERIFNIGTIRIFTNASSGNYGYGRNHNMKGKNGIFIHCVKNVKDEYNQVKEIIDEGLRIALHRLR